MGTEALDVHLVFNSVLCLVSTNGDGSSGRPPRLSNSFWAVCPPSTRQEPRMSTSSLTQFEEWNSNRPTELWHFLFIFLKCKSTLRFCHSLAVVKIQSTRQLPSATTHSWSFTPHCMPLWVQSTKDLRDCWHLLLPLPPPHVHVPLNSVKQCGNNRTLRQLSATATPTRNHPQTVQPYFLTGL